MVHYNFGKFSGFSRGMNASVRVTASISDNKIREVQIDIGKEEGKYADIAEKMREEILAKQTYDVDVVSGATVTSRAIKNATFAALHEAIVHSNVKKFKDLTDGTFTGTAKGYQGPVEVKVTAKDNKIAAIKVLAEQEDQPKNTFKVLPQEIVAHQTVNVDAISGATVSSRALQNAVDAALDKAGDSVAWNERPFQRNRQA